MSHTGRRRIGEPALLPHLFDQLCRAIDAIEGRRLSSIFLDERFSDHAPLTIDYAWTL